MMEPEILHEFTERIAPRHTALIIIDMQKDFCTPGFGAYQAGRDLTMARSVIPNLARLLTGARAAGATVVHAGFSTLPDHMSDSGPWLAQRRRSTFSSEKLCITGSEGAAFVDELAPHAGELVVAKHRYSAFTGTDLDLLLRARRIRTVIVTGVSTNVCVETTFRSGFELDYYVCVPPDGCASWDRGLHEAALANVNHRFGITPSIDEILAAWDVSEGRAQAAE